MSRREGGALTATKKSKPRRPPRELRERLPSTLKGPAAEAAALVNGVLAGATLDERAESLIALVGVHRGAEGGEALDVAFFASVQAMLHHSDGFEMLGQVWEAWLSRKRG